MVKDDNTCKKSEVLNKLGLDLLIGTPFQEAMSVVSLTAGEELTSVEDKDTGAVYIYSGRVQSTAYTRDGREFYRYFDEGDIFKVTESISDISGNRMIQNYGMDLYMMEETTIVYLPFRLIFEMEIDDRIEALKKIIDMAAREKAYLVSYCLGRLVYSDEEFILKAFESKIGFNAGTPLLAKGMNMNIRSLQRYLKKYEEMGMISRDGDRIEIRDMEMFNNYKKKIER